MTAADVAHLALTAAAGHRSEEEFMKPRMSWRQRRLIRRVFRDGAIHGLLHEHFSAVALQRWGLTLETRLKVDARAARISDDSRLAPLVPAIPARSFLGD